MSELRRAPLKYPGGKGKMVESILGFLPPGNVYYEPFCGSGVAGINAPNPEKGS